MTAYFTDYEIKQGNVVISSGNDAAVALAEHIAGGTDAFVNVMNLRAQRLGMNCQPNRLQSLLKGSELKCLGLAAFHYAICQLENVEIL